MKKKYLLGGVLLSSLFLASCGEKPTEANSPETDQTTAPEVVEAPEPAAAPDSVVTKELAGKTHIMQGGEYVETQLKSADYYLLYFTASW